MNEDNFETSFMSNPLRCYHVVGFGCCQEPFDGLSSWLWVVLGGGEGQLLHQPHEHHEQLRLGQRFAQAQSFT